MFKNVCGVFACHSLAILTLGRTKQLSTALKEYFTQFAKSLGLTDDHIVFPAPTGNCQLGRGGGDTGDCPGLMLPHEGKGGGETQAPTAVTGAPGSHFGFKKTLPRAGVCGAPSRVGPKASSLTENPGPSFPSPCLATFPSAQVCLSGLVPTWP